MKRTNLTIVALVAAGLLATWAPLSAQQPGMGMRDMPMGRGMMGWRLPDDGNDDGCGHVDLRRRPHRLPQAELVITDAQNGVWEPYAAALKKNLQGMQAMRQTMMKVVEAKTPVERLDAHIAAMDGRLASLKEVKPALAALYAALSAEQKSKADQILTGMACMM